MIFLIPLIGLISQNLNVYALSALFFFIGIALYLSIVFVEFTEEQERKRVNYENGITLSELGLRVDNAIKRSLDERKSS